MKLRSAGSAGALGSAGSAGSGAVGSTGAVGSAGALGSGRPSTAAGQTHRAWRFAALLSAALLASAFFVACGPAAQPTNPAASQHATTSATVQGSASGPGSSLLESVPPSGVAADPSGAVQSDLSNLDQLLNGLDDSLSQAGPSASGE
jgi:hypothetical protein